MKKNLPFLIFSAIVLGVLNYAIYEKEALKNNGELVYLELAPVDPRSLMQGDFMQLRYGINAFGSREEQITWPGRGFVVVNVNGDKVVTGLELYQEQNLSKDQRLFRYVRSRRGGMFDPFAGGGNARISIVPNTFFFQEGQANHYRGARYGVFMFGENGDYILIGLADENRIMIMPPVE